MTYTTGEWFQEYDAGLLEPMRIVSVNHEKSELVLSTALDTAKRAAEKQASRERDQERLASGEVTREQLMRKNGFLSALHIAQLRINWEDYMRRCSSESASLDDCSGETVCKTE